IKLNQLKQKLKNASEVEGIGKTRLILDSLISAFKYETSFDDFFSFQFYNLNNKERGTYATTGIMHRFQSKKNKKEFKKYLRNKSLFCQMFNKYLNRSTIYLNNHNNEKVISWITKYKTFIAKPVAGQTGLSVEKINLNDYGDLNELLNYLKVNKLNLLEERIVQHNRLQSLHPMSVNSIRVITNVVNNKVEILGACLKIGVNRVVDNRGVVAPIDVETGIVCGPARSNEFIY